MGRIEEIRERNKRAMQSPIGNVHATHDAYEQEIRVLISEIDRVSSASKDFREYSRDMITRLTAERDAAVDDLKIACQIGEVCATCHWCCNRGDQFPCDKHDDWCGGVSWKWRGVKRKEDA